jgi:hypothetical protein
MKSKTRIFNAIAATALGCSLSLTAHAQIGSGWTSAPETYYIQTSAGCTANPNSSGGGTFSVPSGYGRAEFRYGNLPTNTTNQFQGDLVINSLGGNRVNVKQTFGPDPSTPWQILAIDKNLGGFYDVEDGNPQPKLYSYTIGTSARINTIFNPMAQTVDVYVNGTHIIQDTGHSGPNYNKIGAYVSGSGTGPCTTTWTNIQFWSGGSASGGGSTPPPPPPPTGGTVTKVALRALANNLYVCADNYGNNPLIANRTSVGAWETFDMIDEGNGNIALRAHANNLYVCADNYGNNPLIANRTSVGTWETFHKESVSGGYALKALANNLYVCADNYGNNPLIANRTSVGTWETFVFVNE